MITALTLFLWALLDKWKPKDCPTGCFPIVLFWILLILALMQDIALIGALGKLAGWWY